MAWQCRTAKLRSNERNSAVRHKAPHFWKADASSGITSFLLSKDRRFPLSEGCLHTLYPYPNIDSY
jgi:hypothetical protein